MAESFTMRRNVPVSELAVERYFEVSLFLLVSTGFLTLAGTGKLDIFSVVLGGAAIFARGILLVQNRRVTIPEEWTNYATLAYVGFYALDFFLLSGSFVYATVHLVLFSLAVKIFSVQRERDHVYLAVLSFLMVLAAAVLTVDSIFLFMFCVFLLLSAATFISMEMRHSARAAQGLARELPGTKRSLARSLSLTAAMLVMGTAAGGAAIFFILPRVSGGYMNALAQSNEFVTGFSNDVRLGQIGEIKQSSSVVMHVQIRDDVQGAFQLKWRGIALSQFDGRRWSNAMGRTAVFSQPDGLFHIQDAWRNPLTPPARPRSHASLRYRVLMEPVGINVFFLAPVGTAIAGRYRMVSVDPAGSVMSEDQPIGIYDAYSSLEQPPAEQLRAAHGDIEPRIALHYLQLPGLDPRVAALAARVTANARNNYDKAAELEQYLRSHYGYTLQLSQTPPADPVADFLFTRKRGHCEYFASAMAVMLRTLGIPARLINGFHNGEFNPVTSSYIVRGSDAHTWVEAYFPPYGWAEFDPTPPDPLPANTTWSRMMMYVDAMSEFWREWVINYDFSHQLRLDQQMWSGGRRYAEDLRLTMQRWYERVLHGARTTDLSTVPRRFGRALFWIVAAIVLLVGGPGLLRRWRSNRTAARPERAPRAAASIWYLRMTEDMARRGCPKAATQTPAEFVQTIPEGGLRRSVSAFTTHYERARFGELAEDAKELPRLFEELKKS